MTKDQAEEVRVIEKELLDTLNKIRAIRGYPPLVEFPDPPFCSFCGRSKKEMGALAVGLEAHICIECANEARSQLLHG